MRRALAAAGILGAVALSPVATQAAWADPVAAPQATVPVTGPVAIDDEPLQNDRDDDTGKYGFAGLTGLVGLFGYKKIQEHRATRPAAAPARPAPTGTQTSTGTGSGLGKAAPIGDKDDDGSGSRRI